MGAYLEGCDLRRANLTGADLTGGHLIDCDLAEATLTGVILLAATVRKVHLDGVKGALLHGPVGAARRTVIAVRHPEGVYLYDEENWGTLLQFLGWPRIGYGPLFTLLAQWEMEGE